MVLIGGTAAAVVWRVAGGHWFSVDTPSMGVAAPVGTLVLTRPTRIADLAVGDIVSFTPDDGGTVHTHRVIRIEGGVARTRGDINGAEDPWQVRDANLVGVVVARWWGMAWLVKALPILLFGGALVWLLTRYAGANWRAPLRLVLYPLVVCVAVVWLRPLVGVTLLGTFGENGLTRATVVSTGLLPIRASTPDGVSADLRGGQVAELVSTAVDGQGRLPISVGAHMSWPWWVVCLALCAAPLLASLFVRPRETA
ncbi:hypothetical protein [Actinosynnema sp. NPDC020468]|uniref:hypothetical protein n=1 Tax=Actinosynnema sp. NPDC020468 TaxID=3154488 RepID=UPI0034110A8D